MTNKKIIKEVFNQKINKDNIKDEILKESINKLNFYPILIPISIILILIGTIYTTNNQNKSLKTRSMQNIININEVDNRTDSLIDSSHNHDVKIEDVKKDNLDLDIISNINVPSDLFDNFYYKIYIKNHADKDKYNILHSYELHYSNDKNRSIILSFSSTYKPFRDNYYGTNGNMSIINGINVEIWQNGGKYISLFKYKDYNFDIETNNITEKELIDLIKSIIK